MRVRYLKISPDIASYRLRAIIPARELRKSGIETVLKGPADWAVLQKHGWEDDKALGARRILFDVCDDHFSDEHEDHYRKWCARADVVTCNSVTMRDIIKRETGREAVVIDDPYESEEREAKCRAPVLWFGHSSNLPALLPLLCRLPPTMIVSNVSAPGVCLWSAVTMAQAWAACGMAVIPTTGKSAAKSANRAIEAIRNGLYPACGRLPAYAELGLGSDDPAAEVAARLADDAGTRSTIRNLQNAIRIRFSPETVGKEWAKCFV